MRNFVAHRFSVETQAGLDEPERRIVRPRWRVAALGPNQLWTLWPMSSSLSHAARAETVHAGGTHDPNG